MFCLAVILGLECLEGLAIPMNAGPLAGLRVLELAGIGPSPFCAMMLADSGADVLRIDRPGSATDHKLSRTDLLTRGRRSAVVDLKRSQGVELVLALVESADVLLEGMRPGVAERLSLGPEQCLKRNPRLIYGRMTGWGQNGPLSALAGHDISYIARTGALHMIGRAEGPPQVPLNVVGDFGGGGMLLAFGICAALVERQQSGAGQVIDASVIDGTAILLTQAWGSYAARTWLDKRGVNRLDTGVPWYDVYETHDGQWMAVGALEDKFWEVFVKILHVPDLPDRSDAARHGELRAKIASRFRERTRAEWEMAFADSDACVAPVLSMSEAAVDEHLRSRSTYLIKDGITQPSPAPRFSRTPAALGLQPPLPGEHSRSALADWGVANVAELIELGVVQPVSSNDADTDDAAASGRKADLPTVGDVRLNHLPRGLVQISARRCLLRRLRGRPSLRPCPSAGASSAVSSAYRGAAVGGALRELRPPSVLVVSGAEENVGAGGEVCVSGKTSPAT